MSLVNRLNKALWKPLLHASVWATRTPARHRLAGRTLERLLGGLTISLKSAQAQPDLAGVARESVSRTFREWQRQKILEGSSRAGYVVHKTKLERAVAE